MHWRHKGREEFVSRFAGLVIRIGLSNFFLLPSCYGPALFRLEHEMLRPLRAVRRCLVLPRAAASAATRSKMPVVFITQFSHTRLRCFAAEILEMPVRSSPGFICVPSDTGKPTVGYRLGEKGKFREELIPRDRLAGSFNCCTYTACCVDET